MKKILLLVAIVAVCFGANAQDKKWNVTVGGGLTFPTGDASDLYKSGFVGQLQGTYNINPKFELGLEYAYSTFKMKEAFADFVKLAGGKTDDHSINSFLAKGIYNFTEEGVRPFIGAGVGTFSHKDGDTKFGYAVEGGLKYNGFLFGASYRGAGSEGDVSFNFFQLNVGYTFRF